MDAVFVILTSQFGFRTHNVSKSALFSFGPDINVHMPVKRLSQTKSLKIFMCLNKCENIRDFLVKNLFFAKKI